MILNETFPVYIGAFSFSLSLLILWLVARGIGVRLHLHLGIPFRFDAPKGIFAVFIAAFLVRRGYGDYHEIKACLARETVSPRLIPVKKMQKSLQELFAFGLLIVAAFVGFNGVATLIEMYNVQGR